MKTLISISLFLLTLMPSAIAQNNKQYLLNYYETTQSQLQKAVAGLSEAQMNYKASPESWSVGQCLEHIIATEKMIFGMAKEGLAQPANIKEKGAPTNTDEQILMQMVDRTAKFKAPAELQPEGKYTNPQTAMQDLKAQRTEILAYINSTPEASLRDHVSDTPAGIADAYQSFLFLAGHTARHTLQIQQVKADAGFPK